MFVAIDVGNTNTVIGVDAGDGTWSHQWRFSTVRSNLGADWAAVICALADRDSVDLGKVMHVCLASVVPVATAGLNEFAADWCGVIPLVVSNALTLNVRLGMDAPSEVGTDRIANAVAAWDLFGTATIVVDLGTATKVEAISSQGDFLGGAITIGLGVSIDALAARASRLFAVELTLPDQAIGRNTSEALRSGIVRGHMHQVAGLVADFKNVVGPDASVIFTGGHAAQLGSDFLRGSILVPDLTLDGIRTIHRLNVS